MKNKKFFSFLLILFGLLSLAFSINGNIKKEDANYSALTSMSNDSVPDDTTNNEDPSSGESVNLSKDFSSSFNERGFYKSNSFNKNGEEIINDFNGNLCYSIPLSSEKGPGDLAIDFRINYNGNVNYQILCGDSIVTKNLSGKLNSYNFSAPGWIFSINGLAVQMINFETNFFTKKSYPSQTEITGRDIRLLANGYHITDMLTTPSQDNNDKITIMLGDGSTETLENTDPLLYVGEYKSTSKNSFIKAKVEFIEPGNNAGTLRRMYLMKGDGLTYVYEENVMKYKDHHSQNVNAWFKPTTFLLKYINDRYGHNYYLQYTNRGGAFIGRYWFSGISGISFNYPEIETGEFNGFQVSTPNGNYVFQTDEYYTGENEEHRPRLNFITNPNNETIGITYEPYLRTGLDLSYYDAGYFKVKFDNPYPLYRMSQFINFDGGKKVYTYLNHSNPEITFYCDPENPISAHSVGGDYKGQGRDVFYSNMISTVINNVNNSNINETFYVYNYITNRTDVWEHPVDSTDEYKTSITTTSLDTSNSNNTPNTFIVNKSYRNYVIKGMPNGVTIDYSGIIKLVEEIFSQDNYENEYKRMIYYYCKGHSLGASQLFSGTFLDSVKIENINGVVRQWSYGYEGGGKVPITWKKEVDPLGRVTNTYFRSFDSSGYRIYKYANYKISNVEYDIGRLYLIQQPYYITISKGNDTLQKKQILYYSSFDVTGQEVVSGYPGQIQQEREINPQNSNEVLRSMTYKYYNKDTTGRHLFPNNNSWANNREGKLMETEDAKGNKTKYYYDIISGNEGNILNMLSYHKLKDNGSDVVITESWSNSIFPSRVDNYIDVNRYISNYQQYNNIGNPTKVLNENKYLSEAEYDNNFRLTRLTLPYDFNDLSDTIILTKIDTIITPGYICSGSDMWGVRNERINNNWFTADRNNLQIVGVDYLDTVGYQDSSHTINKTVIVNFKTDNFNEINSIDSAYLIFSPYCINANVNGEKTENYNFRITPLKQYIYSGNDISNIINGIGTIDAGNLGVKDSSDCTTEAIMGYRYDCNYRKIDLKDLLINNLDNGLKICGLKFSLNLVNMNLLEGNIIDLKMPLNKCLYNFNYWEYVYAPRIFIYYKKVDYRIIKTLKHRGGTLFYSYNDAKNKVTIESKIEKSDSYNKCKRVESFFDGFGYLKQSNIYNSDIAYDSIMTKYNYLYQKAQNIDAAGNPTKFSYDKYGTLAETENADNSKNFLSNTFQEDITTTFYDVSNGFFNKQVYTDETNRKFEKYYDAVGNLLREIKYVSYDGPDPDNPFDPDTTISGYPDPVDIQLITDYKYDDLYRVIEVKTPENKRIYYSYDLLGRQSSRTTPDAGQTKYKYDKNNNLLYSQDANQHNRASNIYTYRNYDGLNRLLSIGETQIGNTCPAFDNIDPNTVYGFLNSTNEMLTVNAYDSIGYSYANVFNNVPIDYYSISSTNNTKGALVATAYRTKISDPWGYKFYRYDARGRVIKMWHYIVGLGWKTQMYCYNSQNQITYLNYNPSNDDGKQFKYTYDSTDRLCDVSIYGGIPSESGIEDYPGEYFSFASYTYNKNSQLEHFKFNDNSEDYYYTYNNRNWIKSFRRTGGLDKFLYGINYDTNGNIRVAAYGGSYSGIFDPSGNGLSFKYIYDKSNRLLKAEKCNDVTKTFNSSMTYDKDGNCLVLNRYGASNNVIDNYNYTYYIGSNKLRSVNGGATTQYQYDSCGNIIHDERDANSIKEAMIYDNRNLLIEVSMQKVVTGMESNVTETHKIVFDYDEAGNRVRKRDYLYHQNESDPGNGDNGSSGPGEGGTTGQQWELVGDEYYSRDISGKEIAIYHSTSLYQWNVWGADNTGKITANGDKFFYLKDHLGTIRVVLDASNNIVSAQDFDAWGYPLEGRSYQSENTDYKFTGKQRDTETGWDYFGARYYDARIGRWGQTEMIDKMFYNYSPYAYSKLNPILYIDKYGLDPRVYMEGNNIHIETTFYYISRTRDHEHGLTKAEIFDLRCVIRNMKKWSGEFTAEDGKKYNLVVDAKMEEASGSNYDDMVSNVFRNQKDKDEGYSFIQHVNELSTDDKENRGIGIAEYGNVLEVSDRLHPYLSTGAHEFGHMFGLTHKDSRVYTDGFNSIMGIVYTGTSGKQYRHYPDADDRKMVYDNLLVHFQFK